MRSIAPLSLTQLYERYLQLGAQLQRGEISHEQFVAQAHQLQAQDAAGGWWTIDPLTGSYMTYTAQGWVNATPPPSLSPAQQVHPARADRAPSQGQPSAPSQQASRGLRGCFGSPIVTLLLSVGAALVWFAYTSLSPSSESLDLVTPLVIGGTPFSLRLLQKPLDRLLGPCTSGTLCPSASRRGSVGCAHCGRRHLDQWSGQRLRWSAAVGFYISCELCSHASTGSVCMKRSLTRPVTTQARCCGSLGDPCFCSALGTAGSKAQ